MAHPAFSIANPNRVYALIGAFAAGNPTQFNAADGSGYDFVAEIVLALDRKNPQVAARLLVVVQELALAGGRAARPRRGGAAARRRPPNAVARRRRHRDALAGVTERRRLAAVST